MSGDVQPRKRKDKKKKRDDEASHGVHVTKMGSDDLLLHVHEEHGTGGHWCAKIIFFSLMTILMGLVALIILENRGLSDVDTPLSESRFSDYFDGWVDEHRGNHDDHHDSHGSLEHDDHDDHDDEGDEHDDEDDHDDDDDDKPFEEEADHSEGDEEATEDDDDNVTPEEEDEDGDNATAENLTAEEADEDDEDDEEAAEDDEENVTAEEGDDYNATGEDENVTKEATAEKDDADDDEDDDDDGNKTNEDVDDDNVTKENSKPASQSAPDDDNDPYDEEDDDGTFDSLEKIIDNDASELDLLKEKARQQAAAESKQNPASAENDREDEAGSAPSWASSQIKPKISGGGPQSLDDDDNVDFFEQELRRANDEMMRERYDDALNSFDRLIQKYPDEPQVYLGKAQTLDYYAAQRQSNRLLLEAIGLYKKYLQFNIKDNQLQEYRSAAERCVERLRFLGNYEQSLEIHHLLIGKFPQELSVRNQLAVSLLMLNRLSDAKQILQEILQIWPQDGLALVHYGFVLKQLDHDYHNASIYLRQGIASNAEGTQDGRFYFQLGESLQRLGKQSDAVEVFRKGAALKLFPSVYQRSLYNEANLKAQPFWSLEETTYEKFLKKLQDNWLAIQAEGLNILSKTGRGYFMNEVENLKNKGDWKQFELYSRGQQRQENCLKAPITCSLIQQFPAARDCRRGQVKFSVMHAGTHIWPHCGPTNCRLRAHLGLVVPPSTRIRVAEQERSWQEGKFLIFDDSFEHEVWHEGQGLRLVLIVDVWHPDLTEQQRRTLSAI